MIISDNSDTTIWNNTLLESSIILQEASFVLLEDISSKSHSSYDSKIMIVARL
jgi:hypothetical protein